VPIPGTKYKRLNSIFFVTSIALICARVHAIVTASCAVSDRESHRQCGYVPQPPTSRVQRISGQKIGTIRSTLPVVFDRTCEANSARLLGESC